MQIKNKSQVFNFYNTNGRRSDFINALTIYMKILNEDFETGEPVWQSFPNSLGCIHFYQKVLEMSKGTFNKHAHYDFMKKKTKDDRYSEAFYSLNQEELDKIDDEDLEKFKEKLDSDVEARSRHYTSSLVKVGFVDSNRRISPAGKTFIGDTKLVFDDFEKILPIDEVNLSLLRQALKIRIYNKEYTSYYSPTALLIYILIKNKKADVKEVFELLNSLSPYYPVDLKELDEIVKNNSIRKFMLNYEKNFTPVDINSLKISKLKEKEFYSIFRSRKSNKNKKIHFEFYVALLDFVTDENTKTYNKLEGIFNDKNKKYVLNKTFGESKNFLDFKGKNYKEFLKNNENN